MCQIRNLRADEIECRPKQVYGNSVMILLYKDARCDMKILDETFGVYGWERTHDVINGNLFCSVKVRNPETGEWIIKQDVGTESNTEKEKGEASDSFKRACTNVGIGRELYSSPPIWVTLRPDELNKDKIKNGVKFYVSEIKTDEDKQITFINIIDKDGSNRFTWSKANLKFHELITKVKTEDAQKAEESKESRVIIGLGGVPLPKEEAEEVGAFIDYTLEKREVEKESKSLISKESKDKIIAYITNAFPETQRRDITVALLNARQLKNLGDLKEKDVPAFIADLEKAKPKADVVA